MRGVLDWTSFTLQSQPAQAAGKDTASALTEGSAIKTRGGLIPPRRTLFARRGDIKCRNQPCGLGRLISLSQKFLTSFASTPGLAA